MPELAHPNSRRDKVTVGITARLDEDLYGAINEIAERLMVPRSILVNLAVAYLVERLKDAKRGTDLRRP